MIPPLMQHRSEIKTISPYRPTVILAPVLNNNRLGQIPQCFDQKDEALHWFMPVIQLRRDTKHQLPELKEKIGCRLFFLFAPRAVVRESSIDLIRCLVGTDSGCFRQIRG